MSMLRSKLLAKSLILLQALSLLTLTASTATSRPVAPMPGEKFLTSAQRELALETMQPSERAQLGHFFADDAPGLVVSYVRQEFQIRQGPGGAEEAIPVANSPGGVSNFSIPNTAVAVSGGKPGTSLYMSLIVVRTRTSSPHEWQLSVYSDWMAGATGMDAYNSSEDSMGVAWAGGLYIDRDSYSGQYKACGGVYSPLNIYRSDATPNLGIGYSFREWRSTICNHTLLQPGMRYAFADVRIRETSWKSRTSNVVMKYFHTYGGLQYSLGFGSSGPSISISPTSEQWSAALVTSFSH